ncbi:MAG: dihydrolipoyl dehydrogenase family protein [Motilibacteraceae bacterium]
MSAGEDTGPWDLLVLGGGTAGMVGAKAAASLGARVLLVERDRTGGDCLWTGCVPSKALLAAASAAADARAAGRLGVRVRDVDIDFAAVMGHVHGAIATIEHDDSPQALKDAGVVVASGSAAFTGPDRAEIDGAPVAFRAALLATGADPLLPPIPGLAGADPLTSETLWALAELPRQLVVLGGGPIGCELGQALARLGAQVTVVDAADRLLSREDPAASDIVAEALRRDGVQLVLGRQAAAVHPDGTAGELELDDGSTLLYDRLLVAVGRRPRTTGIGCDVAGVDLGEGGAVIVDRQLRTTNPRIWAAGDVTGPPQFTHTAGVRGSLAATNAVLGLRRSVDPVVPRVTYTSPEVAAVGVGTGEPLPEGLSTLRWAHRHADRAVAEDDTDGFTTLVVDRRGRILGATVVGPRAGETLGELTLAVRHGLTTRDLAGTTHAYPTYNDSVWNPAVADVRARLDRPPTRAVLRAGLRLRRTWRDHAGAAARSSAR